MITLKGRRLIDEADLVIYAGSLVNPLLLEGVSAEIYDSAGMTLEEMTTMMIRSVRKNKDVVRLHTGDTSFYSAISEQIEVLRKEGLDYEVVPGVSSAMAAAAAIGQELTIPEISQTVIFTRIAGRTGVPERESLKYLAQHKTTIVIFLSISLIEKVVKELLTSYPSDTPVVVVEKASWPEQQVIGGVLDNITTLVREAGIKKTALIFAGDALKASTDMLGKKSKLYDKNFKHGYRK